METVVAVVVACVALTVIAVGFYYLEKKEIEHGDQQPAGGTSDGEVVAKAAVAANTRR